MNLLCDNYINTLHLFWHRWCMKITQLLFVFSQKWCLNINHTKIMSLSELLSSQMLFIFCVWYINIHLHGKKLSELFVYHILFCALCASWKSWIVRNCVHYRCRDNICSASVQQVILNRQIYVNYASKCNVSWQIVLLFIIKMIGKKTIK